MRFLAARLVQFGFQATADYLLSECAAADEEADKKEETATSSAEPCPTCPDPKKDDDDDDENENQEELSDYQTRTQKKLEESANVQQNTKGKTKHGHKSGGFDQANRDFESLNLKTEKEIQTKYGPGRYGKTEKGINVTCRPGSSDGRPTLEFRNPDTSRGTEIRYNP